jgi:hypothetical protein
LDTVDGSVKDLDFLSESASCLEDYLLSDLLYWPVEIKNLGQQTLSPGNILFSEKVIDLTGLNPTALDKLKLRTSEIGKIRTKWLYHWKEKASREFDARLREWTHVIDEIELNDDRSLARYKTDARGRVIMHLIVEDFLNKGSGNIEKINAVDDRLRKNSSKGPFIWNADREKIFPENQFWYLYINFLKGHTQ